MRSLKSLFFGLAAVAAFLLASSSAMATLSINPVRTTATASGATSLIESTGTSTQLTCGSSSIVDTITSDGRSTIAAGGAIFGTCTLSVAVTQTSAWTNQITALLSGGRITGVGIVFTVPTDGVRLNAPLPGCDFYLTGTQAALRVISPAVTPPALASVGRLDAADFGTALGLTVTRVTSNTLCPAVRVGDAARFAATYNLSPAVTGTLI